MKHLFLILALILGVSFTGESQELMTHEQFGKLLKERVGKVKVSNRKIKRIVNRYERTSTYDLFGVFSDTYYNTLDLITFDIGTTDNFFGLVTTNQSTITWNSVEIRPDEYFYGLRYYADAIHNGVNYEDNESLETAATVDSLDILSMFTAWGGLFAIDSIHNVGGNNWFIKMNGQAGDYTIVSDDFSNVSGGTPVYELHYNSCYVCPDSRDFPIYYGNVTVKNNEAIPQTIQFFDFEYAYNNLRLTGEDATDLYLPACTGTITVPAGETKTINGVIWTHLKLIDAYTSGLEIYVDGYFYQPLDF